MRKYEQAPTTKLKKYTRNADMAMTLEGYL